MPWQMPYLLEAQKWLPPYWPPYSWQVVGSSGPPEGFLLPWWLEDKSNWPYPAPWEPKVLGAFTARRVKMWPEDLQNCPPFGNVKVKTPTTRPHSIGSIKVHTPRYDWLDVSPHPSLWAAGKFEETLRRISRTRPVKIITDSGTITLKSIRSANWNQHRNDERAKRWRVNKPKTPNGNPDLFA